MNNHHIQMVLAAGKYYSGGIDGAIGPNSLKAMRKVEQELIGKYTFTSSSSSLKRRLVGCVQACLDELGFAPGTVDGWEGGNTTEAMNAFLFKEVNGKDEVIDRASLAGANFSGSIPKQSEVGAIYGTPGNQIKSRLTLIQLPFKLRIDWNLRQRTNKIRVHKLAAAQLEKALIEVHAHYGPDKMKELGIDRYAGAYNHRRMRVAVKWSMHAYGCAIDFYAQPNGLRMRCPQALFCQSVYQDFLDIMENNEWLPGNPALGS